MSTYYVTGVDAESGKTVTFTIDVESEAQAHIAASKRGIKIVDVHDIGDPDMDGEELVDSPIEELAKALQDRRNRNLDDL